VKYKSRGKPAEQRQSISYDLHDKTSVTWDDDRKVAAYITPSDSALRNYASFIRQTSKEEVVPAYNESLQFAVQLFHALKEIGCLYQSDPTLPFTTVQENPQMVDSINLPRDTLKRITGDCDDLTVLYCSLLETIGIESGFITVPGHIYPVFNTKVPAREYMQLHPERRMTINLGGELWVPVEITLVGETSFMDAWRQGIDEWEAYENDPNKRGFYQTRKSQELFRPVGLKETDLGLQYGRETSIVGGFQDEMDTLVDAVLSEYKQRAIASGNKGAYNKLGIMYAKFRRFQQAEQAFQDALKQDRRYLGAQVNLANLQYLQKDYRGALRSYQQVYQSLKNSGQGEGSIAVKVLLNMGRAHQQLEQFDDAQEYFAQAKSIDEGQVEQYNFIAQGAGNGEARAAEIRDPSKDILFVSDEE
jgi:tetratricopeptide (TPR) repeat protein